MLSTMEGKMALIVQSAVRFMNQMWVKEGIKDVAGWATLVGAVAFSMKNPFQSAANFSVIVSGLTSRPIVHLMVDKFWGPRTTFQHNPWQPQHLVSIAATVIAIPAVLRATYDAFYLRKPLTRIQKLACFNFFTSRPFLHVVNAACTPIRFKQL
jgi:hypothetical protein